MTIDKEKIRAAAAALSKCGGMITITSAELNALLDALDKAEKDRDVLLEVVEKAAEQIRRCDYTPARSALLVAIKSVKGGE